MSQTVERLSHAGRLERRREIAKAIAAGQSVYEVCQQFEVSRETIRKAADEHGVKIPGTRRLQSVRRKSKLLHVLADLLNTSDSYPQIAQRQNVTRTYVTQVVDEARKAGLTVRGRTKQEV